jgi:hypothetical protein
MLATALKQLFLFSCVEKKSCFRLLLYALQLIFTLFKSGFCSILKLIFQSLSLTALKNFYRCRRQFLKFFNAVADSGTSCWRQRLKFFSDVADGAKKLAREYNFVSFKKLIF